ncbi:7-cyano-7-deazaguanine synthase QueC [Ammonifex thiophilus]|uniref:7-cyano-7-deazaguanine synthase n=1 Tax=Ammonifex thiophilus TaxID=444093 RepID=A0A3D8P2C8_9THEO|nr:7-cyano-7-deazaguanine synthase QueC [Ammonifex thiophilus]RDV82422.1 7-cyano-7-deazaguanine synthase QueC [Ammonifex thiophilus]
MRSVVLLSGGLDSAVCLACAVEDGEVVLSLTFDYGQAAARREIEAASKLARHYGVPHRVLPLSFLQELLPPAMASGEGMPEPETRELDDEVLADQLARSVWVPNRNALFLSVGAAFAESLGAEAVVAGFNAEEAQSFPDNSPPFVNAVNEVLRYSTRGKVRVISYTQRLDKRAIVRLGKRLGLPFSFIWSCYRAGEEMCGRCPSCLRYFRALREVEGE